MVVLWLVRNDLKNLLRIVMVLTGILLVASIAAAIVGYISDGSVNAMHNCFVLTPNSCTYTLSQLNNAIFWKNLSIGVLFYTVPLGIIGALTLVVNYMSLLPEYWRRITS